MGILHVIAIYVNLKAAPPRGSLPVHWYHLSVMLIYHFKVPFASGKLYELFSFLLYIPQKNSVNVSSSLTITSIYDILNMLGSLIRTAFLTKHDRWALCITTPTGFLFIPKVSLRVPHREKHTPYDRYRRPPFPDGHRQAFSHCGSGYNPPRPDHPRAPEKTMPPASQPPS